MKHFNKQQMRTASLFMVLLLAGIVVLTAQPARTQLVPREMFDNTTMMLLHDNPMLPDSMAIFEYGTNARTFSVVYHEYDQFGRNTVMETYNYKDHSRTRQEMTWSSEQFPTYRAMGQVPYGYDRVLKTVVYQWESGNWTPYSGMTLEYDAIGLLTKYTVAGMDFTVESAVDAQNRVISEKETLIYDPDLPPIYTLTYSMEFGSNGKLKKVTLDQSSTGGGGAMSVSDYTYNAKDLLDEINAHGESWGGGTSQESWSRQKHTYDNQDRLIRVDNYNDNAPQPTPTTWTDYSIWYYGGATGIADDVETDNYPSVQIYPNPTSGELRVESGELRVENVEIFDITGRAITIHYSHTHYSHTHYSRPTLDISYLSTGVYFLRITTENGVVTKKIIKSER